MAGAVAVRDFCARRRQDHLARVAAVQPVAQRRPWKAIRISGRFTNTTRVACRSAGPRRARASCFIFIRDVTEKNTETGADKQRAGFVAVFHLAPRFQRQRTPANSRAARTDGAEQPRHRAQLVAALVAVARRRTIPKPARASQSLLWNLYRHDTTPDSKKCSLLFGLFQYQSDAEMKRLRLFYIPVMNTQSRQASPQNETERNYV